MNTNLMFIALFFWNVSMSIAIYRLAKALDNDDV